MNHFTVRLICCFLAEDTKNFRKHVHFTYSIKAVSATDSSSAHYELICELFRPMKTRDQNWEEESIACWAWRLSYLKGRLFFDFVTAPSFSKFIRLYLLHIGNLGLSQVNTDILGSMNQEIAGDKQHGAQSIHYTSVLNIQKVLSPHFFYDPNSTTLPPSTVEESAQ